MTLARLFRQALFASCLLAGLAIAPSLASAQDWRNYREKFNLFSLSFPGPYDVANESYVYVNDRSRLCAAEVVATLDLRPYEPLNKYYILKMAQTLGKALTEAQQKDLLDREIKAYTKHYTAMDGTVVQTNFDSPQGDDPGGYVAIEFEDPKQGPQMVKARFVLTSHSLFQHIVISTRQDLLAPVTKDFLNSLIVENGLCRAGKNAKSDWKPIAPPLEIFTASLPPPAKPYLQKEPEISSQDKSDRISATFYDPLWRQNLFVNVYGYEMDREIGRTEAEAFLHERFTGKYPVLAESTFTSSISGLSYPAFEVTFSIKPPDESPYMDTVRVRIGYARNYIMAYELRGSKNLTGGPLADALLEEARLTSGKALQKRQEKSRQSPAAAPAPQAQPPQTETPPP